MATNTTLTDLIISQWARLSESAREHVLATRAVAAGYMADDGNCEVEYEWATTGREAAEAYVSDGDWESTDGTYWVTVYTWPLYALDGRTLDTRRLAADTSDRESHLVEVEPTEPECAEGSDGHDWQDDGGPWNIGAGVSYREACHRCGCTKTVDTAAQHDGRLAGRAVRYERDAVETDWESINERCDAVTPEHLGPDASDDDVTGYCDVLRRVGPEYATRDEWVRLEEAVLAGEHGEWHEVSAA